MTPIWLIAALTVSAECSTPAVGTLGQPVYSLDVFVPPARPYIPQPGDIILYSDTNAFWRTLYAMALSPAVPGHSGIVVRMRDGQLGILEAGVNDTPWMRVTPIAERLTPYKGRVWIRRRKCPLTEVESARLTEFALAAQDRFYAVVRFAAQITPFRSRGPIRTAFLGKPRGIGQHYHCAEMVMEAAVYAGLLDPITARPAATYPRDIFFDRSPNPYINRHLNLLDGWEPPARWWP